MWTDAASNAHHRHMMQAMQDQKQGGKESGGASSQTSAPDMSTFKPTQVASSVNFSFASSKLKISGSDASSGKDEVKGETRYVEGLGGGREAEGEMGPSRRGRSISELMTEAEVNSLGAAVEWTAAREHAQEEESARKNGDEGAANENGAEGEERIGFAPDTQASSLPSSSSSSPSSSSVSSPSLSTPPSTTPSEEKRSPGNTGRGRSGSALNDGNMSVGSGADGRLSRCDSVHWQSFVWRRGTIPIRWHVDLKAHATDPEIILEDNVYEGTDTHSSRN